MQYELATLKDVFEKVPADRIEDCMKELAIGMAQAKAMRELLTLAGSEIAEAEVVCDMQWPEPVTWVDDGAGKIDLSYCGGPDGDELMRQEIQITGSNA